MAYRAARQPRITALLKVLLPLVTLTSAAGIVLGIILIFREVS